MRRHDFLEDDDKERLSLVVDTHQRCRHCGAGIYPVTNWVAEALNIRRKWFCSRTCKEAWIRSPDRPIGNGCSPR